MYSKKLREGDIVIDKTYPMERKVIVLWNGFCGQPLLTDIGNYAPYWSTYEGITEVIGHVDIAAAVTNLCKEVNP